MDCGWDPVEIEHYRNGEHQYFELEIIFGLRLILCDFCMVDFGSYRSEFFGLPSGKRIGFEQMKTIREVSSVGVVKDKFCPECCGRLKFLRFVSDVRSKALAD